MFSDSDPLDVLAAADPALAQKLGRILDRAGDTISDQTRRSLVDEILWGVALEEGFGRELARGYRRLAAAGRPAALDRYRHATRRAGRRGAGLGRIVACHLAAVLAVGDRRLERLFFRALAALQTKGTYALEKPLAALEEFISVADFPAARNYLRLLVTVFGADLSYNRCMRLTYRIPQAARVLARERRAWQLAGLERVARRHHRLVEPFQEGIQRGLDLLGPPALSRFLRRALSIHARNARIGSDYLALASELSRRDCTRLQAAAALDPLRPALDRYLQARTGRALAVRPLADLPAAFRPGAGQPAVCSDGLCIYLPDRMAVFPRLRDNTELYKCLARMEAGLHEFGSFDFDLDRFHDRRGSVAPIGERRGRSDLELFFSGFDQPQTAADLFTAVEQGRVRLHLAFRYPGLVRRALPGLQAEARRLYREGAGRHPLFALYARLALDWDPAGSGSVPVAARNLAEAAAALFNRRIYVGSPPEASAEVVAAIYPQARPAGGPESGRPAALLPVPFGRRLLPGLVRAADPAAEKAVAKLQRLLAQRGLRVYRADLRRRMRERRERFCIRDIRQLVVKAPPDAAGSRQAPDRAVPDLSWLDLDALLGREAGGLPPAGPAGGPVFWYREWDQAANDYLPDHVRVCQRRVPGMDNGFYRRVLRRRRLLVAQVRRAFELLRPRGLVLLRRWVEGDAFDYRALIDYAVERQAGRMPSDRLYIKRVKQRRDVAVLLLVDLSRSTANAVPGHPHLRVLDVEKEALVLFCEALQVVGDRFAVAGFSGTGRLGVDYFTIKGFEEVMGPPVRDRIDAAAPQRSTRMGAAIRHAVSDLEAAAARVRLLILLGDGFPNDNEYKGRHAIEDTRRAVLEAQSCRIHFHAITVNVAADGRLDALYGRRNHTLISDVEELPGKLLRIYGALTRR